MIVVVARHRRAHAPGTVARRQHGHGSVRTTPVRATASVAVPRDVRTALHLEAARRGTTVAALVAALVRRTKWGKETD